MWGDMGEEPGAMRYPYDIACGPGDLLYVVEFNNHRVSVFTKDGSFVRRWAVRECAAASFAARGV